MSELDKNDEDKRRVEREPEDAGDRVARDVEAINRVMRNTLDSRTEMGRGPEIVEAASHGAPPPGWDIAYSSQFGMVLVPPSDTDSGTAEDKILEAMRERIRAEIEAQTREAVLRERDENMTKPTARDVPVRESELPAREPEPPRQEAPLTQARYDSQEHRQAIAAHLTRLGVAPELAAVRMLMEIGQGAPASEIPQRRAEEEQRQRDIQLRMEREAQAKDLREKGKAVEKQMRDEQRGLSRGDDLGK